MDLTSHQREIFRQVSGLFLPGWQDMPDAAHLEIEMTQLDQALQTRPKALDHFVQILDGLMPPVDANQITSLQEASPQGFHLLKTFVCGAYYLHPAVKDALGYSGQQSISLPKGGFGGEELVIKMMKQPKRYRNVT